MNLADSDSDDELPPGWEERVSPFKIPLTFVVAIFLINVLIGYCRWLCLLC